jgi:hypothetical protein
MSDSQDGGSSPRLLNDIGKVLDGKRVRWATIGALAVAYHGMYRASLDADALISMRGADLDLDGLAETLRAKGLTVDVRMGDEGDPLGFVVRITDGAPIKSF